MAFLTFVLPKLSSLLPNAGSKEGLSARQASGSLWHQWWWHRSVAILNRSRAAALHHPSRCPPHHRRSVLPLPRLPTFAEPHQIRARATIFRTCEDRALKSRR